MLENNFILTPDYYLKPDYKISPFRTGDIRKNINILESKNREESKENFEKYFKEMLFPNEKYVVTLNAREAIYKALKALSLEKDDEIAILTPTNNLYISSCVTKEIEKICSWSRIITSKTKAIFINHEFGLCFEKMKDLKKYNLPIIEDCAHSFDSNNSTEDKGKIGDFVIYSFPKYFPIQIGGILKYNQKYTIEESLEIQEKEYIQIVVGNYLEKVKVWSKKRKENYDYLSNKMKKIGYETRFELKLNFVPGVYMFKNSKNLDLNKLKIYLWSLGIECSVFYGEDTFFIPVNQKLKKEDLDYFIVAIENFGR
ncbi:DegT/DnrJ/EryC1/StrS family aminotransferase [Cetobacterium sp.]|uniref:DegT/DnrJ/EryC1/StrS family aminotransferase n=1 Tax=Cetobacterium sp. TaxID=2071632 RepID=UPI003F2F1239